MHKNIFPLLITFLGIVTAYTFYTVWHTDEMSPSQANSQSLNAENKPKDFIPKKRVTSNTLNMKDVEIQRKKDIKISSENNKDTYKNNTLKPTPQEMQEQTQEVYASLTPDSYEEVQQQAESAFEAIDEYAESINTETMLEEEIIQEVMANR